MLASCMNIRSILQTVSLGEMLFCWGFLAFENIRDLKCIQYVRS